MKYCDIIKTQPFSQIEKSDRDWLFCEVLGKKRSELLPSIEISKKQQRILNKYAKKLNSGVPLAQVLGYTEFCEHKICVTKNVLCPRAETEELADIVKKDLQENKTKKILDLCTGSGAIAIALADCGKVCASDISTKALMVAKKNAKKNHLSIEFVHSNMFDKIWGLFDVIVCNPPYIALDDKRVDQSVLKHEPHIALFAKDNGLEFYKILSSSAKYYLYSGAKLYMEVGIDQAEQVAKLFEGYSSVAIKKDMQNINRFVVVTK